MRNIYYISYVRLNTNSTLYKIKFMRLVVTCVPLVGSQASFVLSPNLKNLIFGLGFAKISETHSSANSN